MTAYRALKSTPVAKRRPDVMIGVMGPTGTGKSSFIRLITGNKNVHVGHSVDSMTSEVELFDYVERDGRRVTFVDTPGFDDSREGQSDTEVLKKIASFLDEEFKDGKKLSGIIYLHRITDPRMGGISGRNLKTFGKLCGRDALKNVVVVTTRWDEVSMKDTEAAGRRERELMNTKGQFFEPLIGAGGRFLQHNNTFGSACRIMESVLDNDPIMLQIQVEMDKGMKLEETAAGCELAAEMKKLMVKNISEIENLQKEMAEAMAEKDEISRKELEAERMRLRREIEKGEEAKKQVERDLELERKTASAAREEAERRMREQHESFVGDLRKVEEKAEKERRQLKAATEQTKEANSKLENQIKQADAAKRNMDNENKRRMDQIQRQVDQARRDKEDSDRKYQRILQRSYY